MKSLIKLLASSIVIIFSYYFVNKFQIYLLTGISAQSSENLLASFIYLPHGIRVIATYIFGLNAFLGLFIAHLITGAEVLSEINSLILTTSFFSTISPFIAIYIIFRKFDLNLNDIRLVNIIITAFLSAVLNSFFSVTIRFLFNFYKNEEIFSVQFAKFFIGDVLGVVFLFIIFILFLNLKKIIFKS